MTTVTEGRFNVLNPPGKDESRTLMHETYCTRPNDDSHDMCPGENAIGGIDTTEDWEAAQAAARSLETVRNSMPGWLVEETHLNDIIDALYETEDPGEEENIE